jgi:hypothetical protein
MLLSDMDEGKKEIIRLFNENVRGKKAVPIDVNTLHDGKDGHWLETQMGIKHNRDNEADLLGYEMKNQTQNKTTFGDWSADYYIYKDPEIGIIRDDFICIFGKPNMEKGGRYSWSGEPCPKISGVNSFGQQLIVDEDKNILAVYHFSKDRRVDKSMVVPKQLQIDNLTLALWEKSSISQKLERKFNNKGWFICQKDSNGIYNQIAFGNPTNYDNWIELVKKGVVFFDSGMYQTNNRNYSQWRANNSYWYNLITSRH